MKGTVSLSEFREILEKHGLWPEDSMALMMTITFNTTDGKSHRFEGVDGHAAYLQYIDRKYGEIFIPGEIKIYIVKRHIVSVVISD